MYCNSILLWCDNYFNFIFFKLKWIGLWYKIYLEFFVDFFFIEKGEEKKIVRCIYVYVLMF